ncbi:MAG TPA: hypothetical protein VFH27_17000, partial [Longimicrobiaceae bacterium]|nr:hypothetical protein [Longimicrobiaceae bacterium]
MPTAGHRWLLIAPWWRWERQMKDLTLPGPRATRPELQKYETAGFVKEFQKDPQRCLRWKDEDFVHTVSMRAPLKVGSGPLADRVRRFSDAVLQKTEVRKLFLTTHKRFYLVVCELHCDVAGLPSTTRDQVCEAGFVVRRRLVSYPKAAETEAAALVKESAALTARLAALDRAPLPKKVLAKRHVWARQGPPSPNGSSAAALVKQAVGGVVAGAVTAAAEKVDASVAARRAELEAQLAAVRAKLLAWKDANGVRWIHEGWVPSSFDKVGSWQPVEEAPQTVAEAVFPLYPLVPDPRVDGHDAQGRNLYFG